MECEDNLCQMEYEDKLETLAEQSSSVVICGPPVVGQTFNSWEKMDRFMFLYAKSQKFICIIRGSEYKNGVCRSHRYACEHQGCNSVKKKTNIVKNQWEMQSKHIGCRWQVRASCSKTMGVLRINSLSLSHNDHPIIDKTNRVFTAGMQSTQRVEDQNAIIKSSVNGNTSLINLAKHIDDQISRASPLFNISIGLILLWVGLQLDSIEKVDLSTQCNLDTQSNIFVEDAVDAPAILIQELLSSTEVDSILEIWKQNASDNGQSFPDLSFCLPEILFSDIHAKVSYRKAYVTANSLSKKAIQIGLDAVNEKHIEQQEDEDKYISNSSSSDEDFVVVKNPIVHSRRGAPRKKRFKGSHELESNKSKQNVEGQKARKATQCQ
ncbi:protein far1-related sequence 11-like isoform x1 [Gigaspora margarita]|uniref:Protein far1-related sequence 11-like isoform x1 n=1 Tax=Gigaspora margarita TaxID=4874 RepID=A0A8H3X9F3_GIGMA|nr:protein far1-related sequence 11-like isoform x1 [Gigaspora margarita]